MVRYHLELRRVLQRLPDYVRIVANKVGATADRHACSFFAAATQSRAVRTT